MTTATPKNTALVAFMQGLAAVEAEINELKASVEDHLKTNPDNLNWADVGDLSRILHLLREANGKESA